jgi:predicted small secreted protein
MLARVAGVPGYETGHTRYADAGAVCTAAPSAGALLPSHPHTARHLARFAIETGAAVAKAILAAQAVARTRVQSSSRALQLAPLPLEPRTASAGAVVATQAPAAARHTVRRGACDGAIASLATQSGFIAGCA